MKKKCASENSTVKKSFHSKVLIELKTDTNLTRIRKKLGISKENLNYYLRGLKKKEMIIKKGTGWYEVKKGSENSTEYGSFLPKDFIRGHAYIIKVNFPKEIKKWDQRIGILEKSNINYKLVGILKNIPRIKAMGRKVWLCNNHLRIFDKKEQSYYDEDAVKSRFKALKEFINIIQVIENKLKINLKPYDIEFQKEHYALIKNDLAIDQNKKGIIWRINDEEGEWLLIDDSLEMGGELENVGKKAFKTNPKMQKWWNKKKENDFKIDDDYIQKGFSQTNEMINNVTKNQQIFDKNMSSHLKVLNKISKAVDQLTTAVKKQNIKSKLNEEQKTLNGY